MQIAGGVWLSGTTMHQHIALVRHSQASLPRETTQFLNSRMASQQSRSKSRRSPYLGCDAGRFFGLVTKHVCDRHTDGQTDRQTELRLLRPR